MKNKKSLYFLAPVVLLVWALIFYQVSEGLQTGNPYYAGAAAAVANQATVATDSFEYTLLLNYPDPFLGRASAGATHKATATVTAVQASAKPAITPSLPATVQEVSLNLSRYKYLGVVEHKGKKDKLALISIDGKSLMLREGDVAEELQLLKISKDSIQLKNGKQVFYVKQ